MNLTKKILVVEDDKFLLEVYGARLRASNFEVYLLEDGTNAHAAAKTFKPNLVFLDLAMPNKDGYEVLRELKASPETAHIPVIVISKLDGEEDIAKSKALGAAEHFVKTKYSFNEIKALMDKFLL